MLAAREGDLTPAGDADLPRKRRIPSWTWFRALALGVALALRAAPARADVVHTVARGETLAGLSERYYGSTAHEAVIVAANFLHLQQSPALPVGAHLTIPAVSYYRVAAGDTWEQIAQQRLGTGRRGAYLARINGGSFELSPSPGAVIRLPYLLRYVVMTDEPLFEIARRYYGDRALVQFITEFNNLGSQRLTRGQVLTLPIPNVELREPPAGSCEAAMVQAHASQRLVARDLPQFLQMVSRGLYVEAAALGARLQTASDLTTAQRVSIDRGLAEAYVALGRADLAAQALRDALAADPGFALDPVRTPPKVLEAMAIARGTGSTRPTAPPPPTSRPDTAH